MRALFLPIMLGVLATPAGAAQSLQVIGYSGYLGRVGVDRHRYGNGSRLEQRNTPGH